MTTLKIWKKSAGLFVYLLFVETKLRAGDLVNLILGKNKFFVDVLLF